MLDQSCLQLENFPIMLMRMRLVWSRQKLQGEMGSPVAILGSCSCGSSPAATVLSPQAPMPTELGSAHRSETSEWWTEGHTDQDLSTRHGETTALPHSSDSHGHGKAQAAFLKAGHHSESPWELLFQRGETRLGANGWISFSSFEGRDPNVPAPHRVPPLWPSRSEDVRRKNNSFLSRVKGLSIWSGG